MFNLAIRGKIMSIRSELIQNNRNLLTNFARILTILGSIMFLLIVISFVWGMIEQRQLILQSRVIPFMLRRSVEGLFTAAMLLAAADYVKCHLDSARRPGRILTNFDYIIYSYAALAVILIACQLILSFSFQEDRWKAFFLRSVEFLIFIAIKLIVLIPFALILRRILLPQLARKEDNSL